MRAYQINLPNKALMEDIAKQINPKFKYVNSFTHRGDEEFPEQPLYQRTRWMLVVLNGFNEYEVFKINPKDVYRDEFKYLKVSV